MERIILILLALMISGCGITEKMGKNCGGDLKELCHNVFGGRNDSDQQNEIDGNAREIDELKKRLTELNTQLYSVKDQMVALGDALDVQGLNLQGQVNTLNGQVLSLQTNQSNEAAAIANLQSGAASLLASVNTLAANVSSIGATQSTIVMNVSSLQSDAMQLSATVSTLTSLEATDITNLQGQISSLQTGIAASVNTITTLQTTSNTVTVQLATLMGYQNIVEMYDPCGPQGSWNEIFLKLSSGKYVASFSANATGLNTRFTVLEDGNYVTTDGSLCYFTVSGGGTVISNEHN